MEQTIRTRSLFPEVAPRAAEDLVAHHEARSAAPFAGQSGFRVHQPEAGGGAIRAAGSQAPGQLLCQTLKRRHARRIHVRAHVCLNKGLAVLADSRRPGDCRRKGVVIPHPLGDRHPAPALVGPHDKRMAGKFDAAQKFRDILTRRSSDVAKAGRLVNQAFGDRQPTLIVDQHHKLHTHRQKRTLGGARTSPRWPHRSSDRSPPCPAGLS